MYRGTWLVLAVPLLLAAFSVARPIRLDPPELPTAFDAPSATALAGELARFNADRVPGSSGAAGAADWFRRQLAPYGFPTRSDRFRARIPGRGEVELENLTVVARGRSTRSIVLMAHRDNTGAGPGANDNASGTAALIALARSYATPSGAAAGGLVHRLVFLSTDGGAYGGLGADHFARNWPERDEIVAVINLDSIAGTATPRLVLTGDTPRLPNDQLVRTAASELQDETGRGPPRDGMATQLLDLAFPFSLYEQAPFVARGIPALTITTAGDRPPDPIVDTPAALDDAANRTRLAQIGRAAQSLIGSLDQAGDLPPGPSSYLYLGDRFVRGWAVVLVLVTALVPFLAAAVDLFARCRRRHIALAPALRSYRSRLAFWFFVGFTFWLLGRFGAWPDGAARPPALETDAAERWPALGLTALVAAAGLAWVQTRARLVPRRTVTSDEKLAGHTAALLVLGVIALLVVATNAYALIFVLPSLHAWLWLPQVRDRPLWTRAAVLAAGFAGPLLLLSSFATRYGLGLDAPWYLAELASLGYVPVPAMLLCLAWLAVSGQLAALAAGRYAPYPSAAERPPRGPLRELIKRVLLLVLARRRASARVETALEA
jgi:hypothetical protein